MSIPVLIHDPLGAAVERSPGKTALVSDGERVSYAQLHRRVRALASTLRQCGTRRGDRVALFLDNGIAYVVGIYAVLEVGAIFVPLIAQTRTEKLARLMEDAGCSTLLTDETLRPIWAPAVASGVDLRSVLVTSGAGCVGTENDDDNRWYVDPSHRGSTLTLDDAMGGMHEIIDQDLAAILYTSGSTGESKGVMLSHLNMVSAARSVIAYLGMLESDVILCALSLAHGYGLYQVLMGIWVGATVVIERSFAFPAQVLETAARERATVIPGVPAMYARLITFAGLEKYDLGALRILTNAAEGLPEHRILEVCRLFPQAQFFSMYGQTECKRVTFLPPEEVKRRPGSVGRGMPNQEWWLVDADGCRLPYGTTGELVVRGSHVMRGYWGRPDETAKRLRPGPGPGELVLHTGDIFRTDEEGWLYFVARSDDIIKSRGEKISPGEVEAVIQTMRGVREVAVIGVADVDLGQAVKAIVVLEPDAQMTGREIIRHCLNRLESYMAPRSVAFMDELPRSATGKVQKSRLG